MAIRTSLTIGAALAFAGLATAAQASSGAGDRAGAQYDDDVSYGRPESKATDGPRSVRRGPPPPRHGGAYDYAAGPGPAYDDDGVTYGGRWVGTWYGKDGTTYNGEYEGEYRGGARGVTYDAPPERGPYWSGNGGPAPTQGGYVANGWYYPAPTVTTVTVQPGTTTTTTTTTYVTQSGRGRRHVRK